MNEASKNYIDGQKDECFICEFEELLKKLTDTTLI